MTVISVPGITGDPSSFHRPGDTDRDGDIDITDLNRVIRNVDPLGNNPANDWSDGNFDGDDDIDIIDFNLLAVNFAPLGYVTLTPVAATDSLRSSAATAANAPTAGAKIPELERSQTTVSSPNVDDNSITVHRKARSNQHRSKEIECVDCVFGLDDQWI